MAGLKRGLRLLRVFAPSAIAFAMLGTGACYDYGSAAPSGQGGGAGAPSDEGPGAPGLDPIPSAGSPFGIGGVPAPCVLPPSVSPVFQSQAVGAFSAVRRELFSWTTDERAAALRRDRVLFTAAEQATDSPSDAFTFLNEVAKSGSEPDQQALAGILDGALFSNRRYAWSEPWATRMGLPGGDNGRNLLRVALKSEAWLVIVSGGVLSVVDLDNQPVSIDDAVRTPARIGAIFFVRDAGAGGPVCSNFVATIPGYREFILGNLAMVEEWSIGTQEIRDRLSANIADLTGFLPLVRACPLSDGVTQWNPRVVCDWSFDIEYGTDEARSYEHALAIPSIDYLPVPRQLATLIETLQGDLFDPDPLIVKPGSL